MATSVGPKLALGDLGTTRFKPLHRVAAGPPHWLNPHLDGLLDLGSSELLHNSSSDLLGSVAASSL